MLGEAVRLYRWYHEIKAYKMAKKLGVANSHLSHMESGRRSITQQTLKKYAKIFDTQPSKILQFAETLSALERARKKKKTKENFSES